MMQTKKLLGECQHCGKPIEFDAAVVGTTAECPYCGQPTELMLALPPETASPWRTKALVLGVVLLVIVVGGVGGTMLALKRARRMAAQQQEAAVKTTLPPPSKPGDPFAAAGFRVSPVTLEKGEGSSIVYAVGMIGNTTGRQRFGVRVELELLDAGSNKVGNASDYRATLDPNADWRFRALVVDRKATSARVVTIKEDK